MNLDHNNEKKSSSSRGDKKIHDFTDLIVWQKAHELVLEIYRISKNFPNEERFGLTIQMRRAAVSIAANIAEGFKRKGEKGKIQFYNISQSSLEETRYYLILCRDLKYHEDVEKLLELCSRVGQMLTALIKSIAK